MKSFLPLLFASLAGSSLFLPISRADTLDDTVIALMREHAIPGLSIAIIKDGAIVKARGYGAIDGEGSPPITAETLFQAASISKPVSALGALCLVEHGKLSLDGDVNQVLRAWHIPENPFTATSPVTLRRLLSHTAGLTVHGFSGYAPDAPLPSLVEVLNGMPPANSPPIRVDVAPGTLWRYSGGGYTVMQQIVIDVSGQTFPEFMKETVLDPLGMHASSYEQPLPAGRAALAASGHLAGGKPVPERWHVYPESAAAGLWTTPSDLALVAIAMQHAVAGGRDAVLSPAMARLMLTNEKESYGLGFSLASRGTSKEFGHDGSNEGFDSMLIAYRDLGLGAVLMININDDSSFQLRVVDAIAREYQWPGHIPYESPKPIEDTEPALTEQMKAIFIEAQARRFEPNLFTPALANVLSAKIPGDEGKAVQAFGTLKSISLIGRRNDGANRRYHYYIVCERGVAIAACTYLPDGKITALSFHPE